MTSVTTRIRPSVQAELDAAASAETQGHFTTAFRHLERAHVIGQPSTVEHVRVHWRMFRFALRNRRSGEAYGQAWRLAAATVFTPVGLVPTGNTGGADVSGIRRMAIPKDLQAVIDAAPREQRSGAATCNCTARNQQPSSHADICAASCQCASCSCA